MAIAALCLVGQLTGLAHLLVVRHVECAAHGEMVHVARGPARTRAALVPAPADHSVRLLARDDHAALLDPHEHCQWLSHVREARAHRAPVAVAVTVTPVAAVAARRERMRAADRPLFRLAPKVSPPALA